MNNIQTETKFNYALGVMTFQILTSQLPFARGGNCSRIIGPKNSPNALNTYKR